MFLLYIGECIDQTSLLLGRDEGDGGQFRCVGH